jgi:putative hemolysin
LRTSAERLAARVGKLVRRAPPPQVYGRIGDLEVRLAGTRLDLHLAQRLRYEVFYEEMDARPDVIARFRRRDQDSYDPVCDHLLVIDRKADGAKPWRNVRRPNVVGTYRLLRGDVATRHGVELYTASEYDIDPMIATRAKGLRFMEVGRSCVLESYRNGRTMEALWHGLWTYAREHKIDVMIGCASFPGTDPSRHAQALSFLHHHCLAPPEWRARAHDDLHVSMHRMPADGLDPRACMKALPPLIKGYLRLGAFVGDGAVIDRQFGTIDVLIVLPIARIDARYFERFGKPDETVSRIARRS